MNYWRTFQISSKLLPKRVRANLDLGTVLVDYPSPQSVAFFTFKGISRTDQDFFAAFVMNHILGGGGFNSRLMKKIREERGLTYSVNTSLAQYDHAELYLGMFQSSNDKISEAIEILKREIALLANNGVNQEELERAQRPISLALILCGSMAMRRSQTYWLGCNDKG